MVVGDASKKGVNQSVVPEALRRGIALLLFYPTILGNQVGEAYMIDEEGKLASPMMETDAFVLIQIFNKCWQKRMRYKQHRQ